MVFQEEKYYVVKAALECYHKFVILKSLVHTLIPIATGSLSSLGAAWIIFSKACGSCNNLLHNIPVSWNGVHSVETVFLKPGKLHDLGIQSTHVLVSCICEWERARMYLNSVAS